MRLSTFLSHYVESRNERSSNGENFVVTIMREIERLAKKCSVRTYIRRA